MPPRTKPTGGEIVPDNIRGVSAIYAAAQLEQMRLFDTVDRIVEQFVNGQLPIGAGAAGRALDAYYWSGSDRIGVSARRALYTRTLGVPGGDAQPNSEFDGLWARFVAAVAAFSREKAAPAMETVRRSGHDLAVNVSAHGYGYTYFAARRLKQDVASAFAILKSPEIQRAYGVAGPYRVIERVSTMELGGASNIARLRTRAETGKKILDTLARTSSQRTLSRSDSEALIHSVGQWLAASGVQDDNVDDLSQPKESARPHSN